MKILGKIKKGLKKIRDKYWIAKSHYPKFYDSLKIDEKSILLESQTGTTLGNSLAMIRYMSSSDEYKDYKIYITSRARNYENIKDAVSEYKNVEVIVLSTDKYFKVLSSAKYLFQDNTFIPQFMKKKGQVLVNMWHGTPLKTIGKHIKNDAFSIGNAQKNFNSADFLLFPNEFTKEKIIDSYCLENLCDADCVVGGYPRNSVFFDLEAAKKLRESLGLSEKKLYAYMPTWRGTLNAIYNQKQETYLKYYLYELDEKLDDSEVLYVNLHPLTFSKNSHFNFDGFKHIQTFPKEIDSYDFLNICDVLVTDYSSVFFDFACSNKKIVLFPYDKEEYLKDRGLYFPLDDLPFKQCFDTDSLLNELRSSEYQNYDKFLEKFAPFDSINSAKYLCDYIILNKNSGNYNVQKIKKNGKQNVLMYIGNLGKNGITSSVRNLLLSIDRNKYNYYISFFKGKSKNNSENLSQFLDLVPFVSVLEGFNLTLSEYFINILFKIKLLNAYSYRKLLNKRLSQEFYRAYGTLNFDKIIQYTGYEDDVLMMFSVLNKEKTCFVHNDMIQEMKTRNNCRKSVLKLVYNNYDKIIAVSKDIVPSVNKLRGKKSDNIYILNNLINYLSIVEKAKIDISQVNIEACSVEFDVLKEKLNSDVPKFINIGRFSAEKGQSRLVDAFYEVYKKNKDALLFIMGGNKRDDIYEKLLEKITQLGLSENVILILGVDNPYPIINACNYSVLSSFYEGQGIVIMEAWILNKPTISTDVVGTSWMKDYNGTHVPDSTQGLIDGMFMLLDNKVSKPSFIPEEYNKKIVNEFERIIDL